MKFEVQAEAEMCQSQHQLWKALLEEPGLDKERKIKFKYLSFPKNLYAINQVLQISFALTAISIE